MMSVDTRNNMAVETLSQIQDANLYKTKNVEDDNTSEDSFHLQLTDNEEENASPKKTETVQTNGTVTPPLESGSPNETEDDILNKFESTDNGSVSDHVDDKLEETLLDENEDVEKTKLDEKDEENKCLSENNSESSLSNNENKVCASNSDVNVDNEDEDNSVNNSVDISLDVEKSVPVVADDAVKEIEDSTCEKDDKVQVQTEEEESKSEEMEKADEAASEDKNIEPDKQKEPQKEEMEKADDDASEDKNIESDKQKEPQKENEDILKEQIMDTEDLLQISENQQTEETDKEDSSGRNSPRSTEDDAETDKMDTEGDDGETEKMDCEEDDNEEENQMERRTSKDDDGGMDIDESNPFKDCDADIDKEYNNLVTSAEIEESSKAVSEKSEVSTVEKDLSRRASTEEDNTDAPEEKSDSQSLKQKTEDSVTDKQAATDDKKQLECAEIETEENENIECSIVIDENTKETSASSKPGKRSLSDSDLETDAKKLKLDQSEKPDDEVIVSLVDVPEAKKTETKDPDVIVEEKEMTKLPIRLQMLDAIDDFLRSKTIRKFTYKDLEQILLQKICEAICHKSELGELRHQLAVQEQMVEVWRKEVAQLGKQARDLEIVNKRLMHEIRQKHEKDKPLMPVKITRSVGLQVRSDASALNNPIAPKRKINRPQVTPAAVSPIKQSRTTNIIRNTNVNNRVNTVTKVINGSSNNNNTKINSPINKGTSPSITNKVSGVAGKVVPFNNSTNNSNAKVVPSQAKVKMIAPKLSSAQNNTTTTNATNTNSSSTNSISTVTSNVNSTSVVSSTITTTNPLLSKSLSTTAKSPAKPINAEPKTVIDLTDEDDKKPVNTTSSSQGQAVRIVSAPVKTTAVTNSNVVNPPRIMYVYNNQLHQGVLAADGTKNGSPKLMLKLNSGVLSPANGVITAVPNGSTIAVSGASVRTTQVQPVRLATQVTSSRNTTTTSSKSLKHPAPLPAPPANQITPPSRKPVPPKPHLSIKRSSNGLILSWKMPYNLDNYEAIASYQLYAYQETTSPPSSEMWRKVGDVKALALPMACTLTQFADGNKYHFAVRAVDVLKRMGAFSDPEQILL